MLGDGLASQPLLFRLLGCKWKFTGFARRVVFLGHTVSLQDGTHSTWLHSSRDERRRTHVIFISLYLDCRVGFFCSWDALWLAIGNTACLCQNLIGLTTRLIYEII